MKLIEMIEQGFQPRAWTMKTIRGERRVVVKLSKITSKGKRFYVVHSPQVEKVLSDVEFTEPVILKENKEHERR